MKTKKKTKMVEQRRINFILILLFLSVSVYATGYKDVALSYFNETLITDEDYSNTKYFVLTNKNGETDNSNCCDFCLNFGDNFELIDSPDDPLKVPDNGNVVSRLGFLKRIFTPKKRIKYLSIYQPILVDNQIVVVIKISGIVQDKYISVVIDPNDNNVLDSCSKDFYS